MELTKKQLFWIWLMFGTASIYEIIDSEIGINIHFIFNLIVIFLSVYAIITYWKYK